MVLLTDDMSPMGLLVRLYQCTWPYYIRLWSGNHTA